VAPAAAGVENALTLARIQIQPTTPLSLADALPLQTTADGLTSSVKIMIMSIMQAKPIMDQLGITPTVLRSLQNQKALAGALGPVVLGKLPPEGIASAQAAFNSASLAIDMGITNLSGQGLVAVIEVPNAQAPPQAVTPEACAAIGFVPTGQAVQGAVPAVEPPPAVVAQPAPVEGARPAEGAREPAAAPAEAQATQAAEPQATQQAEQGREQREGAAAPTATEPGAATESRNATTTAGDMMAEERKRNMARL
jgi:hypothetical protein